ncbi:MAG: hypothetical protein IKO36_06265 [Bacteroidaceae bacterium]|nr:hypothetical protein [Bacteroidaceae bacterium]
MRESTTKERGIYKTRISNALLQSNNIKEIILGDTSELTPKELLSKFQKHVNSHLFIDETIKDTTTYIFFDVIMPELRPQTKTIQVLIYAICHRDILEDYVKEGYYGNRADILSEMIEETLLDDSIVKKFGIGDLSLDNVDIYNSVTFYGCIMSFSVRNFR